MSRRLTLSALLMVVVVSPARAEEPNLLEKLVERVGKSGANIDPVQFFIESALSFALEKTVEFGIDYATGKPDIRAVDKRLKELEANAAFPSEMREAIRRVNAELNERVTKQELRNILSGLETELCSIKRRLSDAEERLEKQEVEISDLKSGTKNAADATFFLKRGHGFAATKDNHRAIANFTVAIRLDDKLTESYIGRACAFRDLRASEIAFVDFSKAIALEPKNVEARDERASLYYNFKTYNKAIEDLNVSISCNPKDAFARKIRGASFWLTQNFVDAQRDSKVAVELAPLDSQAWNLLAISDEALGNNEAAERELSRAIAIGPVTDPIIYSIRGRINNKLGKHSEAIADCDMAIGRGVTLTSVWESRGLSKFLIGKQDEAIPDLTRAIELGTQYATVYALRGRWYLNRLKQEDFKALADLDSAVSLRSTDWVVRDDRADANFRLGHNSDAIGDYTYSINNNKVDAKTKARSYWFRGLAHKNLGDIINRGLYLADIDDAIRLDESWQQEIKVGDVTVYNQTKSHVEIELDNYVDEDGENQQFFLSYTIALAPGEHAYVKWDGKPITASRFNVIVHTNGNTKKIGWSYDKKNKHGANFRVGISDRDLP